MARPEAPSGISRESLREAIASASMLGLERSAYEAWAECSVRDPESGTTDQFQLAPVAGLSYRGFDLLVRRPHPIGTQLMVRLIQPDASSGPEQSIVVHAIEPTHDQRWWRCSVWFAQPGDCIK